MIVIAQKNRLVLPPANCRWSLAEYHRSNVQPSHAAENLDTEYLYAFYFTGTHSTVLVLVMPLFPQGTSGAACPFTARLCYMMGSSGRPHCSVLTVPWTSAKTSRDAAFGSNVFDAHCCGEVCRVSPPCGDESLSNRGGQGVVQLPEYEGYNNCSFVMHTAGASIFEICGCLSPYVLPLRLLTVYIHRQHFCTRYVDSC